MIRVGPGAHTVWTAAAAPSARVAQRLRQVAAEGAFRTDTARVLLEDLEATRMQAMDVAIVDRLLGTQPWRFSVAASRVFFDAFITFGTVRGSLHEKFGIDVQTVDDHIARLFPEGDDSFGAQQAQIQQAQ